MPLQEFLIGKAIPGAVAAVGVLALSFWLKGDGLEVSKRIPGTDRPAVEAGAEDLPAQKKGQLVAYQGLAADIPGSWPGFRGRNLDGVSDEKAPLAREWGPEGPPALWTLELGEGHAGPAVRNGRVYLLDYDREKQADAYRCFSLGDGKEIWRYSYPVKVKRNHGMSRTVPAVTDELVVGMGPKCHVTCLDARTGEFRWALDLVKDFGAQVPPWYAGQCPLIEDGRVILAPGGDALLMAADCRTGETIWKSANPFGWKMTHTSVVPMTFRQKRAYVYSASGGVAGVSAEDGAVLWHTAEWKIKIAAVASPVIVGDGKIFLSGGYNAGSLMLQLKADGESMVPEVLFRLAPEVFGSPQHTPILFDSHIYGVRPDGELACLDLEGKVKWSSGPKHRFGLGPFLVADGLICALNDTGRLTLVEASPKAYRQLAEAKILDGHDSWGPMAIVNGRLLLRDLTKLVCLDVSRK